MKLKKTVKSNNYSKYLWHFIKPYKNSFILVYILYLINASLNLLPVFSVRYFIDLALTGQDLHLFGIKIHHVAESPLNEKLIFSLIFFAVILLIIIVANTVGVIMWRKGTMCVEKLLFDIKISIHNHINKLSLSYFNSERIGSIMTKAVGDVMQISLFLKESFNISYLIMQFVLIPVLMLIYSPLLTLIALIPLPVILFSIYVIKVKLKPMYKKQMENQSEINSQIHEVVSGIKEIKAFNMEDRSERIYGNVNWRFYNVQNRIMKVFSFNHQLQYGSKDIGLVLIVVIGGLFVFFNSNAVSLGTITAFIGLATFLYSPIQRFFGFYDIAQRGIVSLERIIDFLKIQPDIKDENNAIELDKLHKNASVVYEKVTFSYNNDPLVLKNINLKIKPGEKIAIVGRTGSGKSTLLSLLMRFYDPNSGCILVNGTDIRTITQRSLRENIGIVFQDTYLFYGSIMDNLLFANPNKAREEIITACKLANIYDFICSLPEQFETVVGERGVRLSGGQKQRLSIARLILKDPSIVILDEATSAVDSVTEAAIQEGINNMLKGRTAFIIAHRLSTIKNCDRIIVLDDKTIAESGSHTELIKKRAIYYNLYKQYA
jgi:ABC-type multidrug transport system fused ATPase/permease subunit